PHSAAFVLPTDTPLHWMPGPRLDPHDLALAGPAGDAHAWLCQHVFHQLFHHSSMQAPSVTTMSAVADRTAPSYISARASTVCDRARRIWVLISAFPARMPR